MGFYVLFQPEEDAEATLVEHAQGHPSLVVLSAGSQITVQIAGREGGAEMAINFARELARAAAAFADRCQALTKLQPLDFEALAAAVGTTPEEVDRATGRHAVDDEPPAVVDSQWFAETGAGGPVPPAGSA
ncbi:hypothetical protein ABZ816_19680 [Actinosynnema sp. NPDC047251]|uniref:Uncharacterized protein n=1 Tax=Saccharothrix espanaensis (strain ATCC 51144 / DSM 44229 / JCM 9112 / NBRC 15066 / NRRL 15764) TaxID=1179773 RepID=K0K3F8_SACES|nr:hypothetical protein [Saccharothrix espanaensis]CCH34785.1 hypothetical protein BN6_75600 [Saccharothrix espanaensis DSM 44229]